MRTRGGIVAILVVVGLVGVALVVRSRSRTDPLQPGLAALAQGEAFVGYPHARWRLAPERLNDVLVRFESIAVSFHDPRERSPVERTEVEAQQRALDLAKEAGRAPSTFGAIARSSSDDARTAPFGGKHGTVRASMLEAPTLDALATLAIGEVSRPFVQGSSFWILHRVAVPPDERVGAMRIVIKFLGAAGAPRGGHAVARAKAEARAVATEIAEEAKRASGAFPSLVEKHSEEYDVSGGGDIGSWPLYNGGSWALVFEVLSELPENEVSDPVETDEGFVILRRTDGHPRKNIAASQIVLSFQGAPEPIDGRVPTRGKEEARALANGLLGTLLKTPESFDELRARYCDLPSCSGPPESWELGRNLATLERAIVAVERGKLVGQVVETPIGFHLVRREDESKIAKGPAEHFEFELPRPEFHDLSYVLVHVPGDALARETRKLSTGVAAALGLAPGKARVVTGELEDLASRFEHSSPNDRFAAYQQADERLRKVLGDELHRKFLDYVVTFLENAQLG